MPPVSLERIYDQVKTGNRSNPVLIADAITHAILHGALPAGAPLRQAELASGFGVSQTPVREALKLVCDTGLAKAEPNRGVAVRKLSADEAREITDLRVLLECDAFARAIPNYTQVDFDTLSKLERKLTRARQIDTIVELNSAFHHALYAPSQREITLEAIHKLRIRFERYLRFVWRTSDHVDVSNEQHGEMVRLADRGHISAASALLGEHIRTTGDVISDRLETGGD